MKKRKILFLANLIELTPNMDKWAKKFGDFEIITWELKTPSFFQQSTTILKNLPC
jgi:hypothetical protein